MSERDLSKLTSLLIAPYRLGRQTEWGCKAPAEFTLGLPLPGNFASPLPLLLSFLTLPVAVLGLRASTMRASIAILIPCRCYCTVPLAEYAVAMAALMIVRCAGRWGSGSGSPHPDPQRPDRPSGGGGRGPSSEASPRDLSCSQAGQARDCTPFAKSGRRAVK